MARDMFAPLLQNPTVMGPVLLVARLFLVLLFIFHASNALQVAGSNPTLYFAVALQLACSVLLVLGYQTRPTALLLAAFCVVTMHWPGGMSEAGSIFITNLGKGYAVVGGLLFLCAFGPGPWSLDERRGASERRGLQGLLSRLAADDTLMAPVLLVARLLPLWIFVTAGTNKVVNTERMQAYMVSHNASVPTNLIYLAIVVQLVPPLLIALGYKTRLAAILLSGFCLIAPILFHNNFAIPVEVEHFFLDFANAGGLLFMAANGPGKLSIDWRATGRGSVVRHEPAERT